MGGGGNGGKRELLPRVAGRSLSQAEAAQTAEPGDLCDDVRVRGAAPGAMQARLQPSNVSSNDRFPTPPPPPPNAN